MSNIGENIPNPEEGWKRVDSYYENFTYIGEWGRNPSPNRVWTEAVGQEMNFNFTGDKLRFYVYSSSDRASDCRIIVDGVEESFSAYGSTNHFMLVFEKTGMINGEHRVKVFSGTNRNYKMVFTAVDIDENCEVLPYSDVICKCVFKDFTGDFYSIKNEENKGIYKLGSKKLKAEDYKLHGFDLDSCREIEDYNLTVSMDKEKSMDSGTLYSFRLDKDIYKSFNMKCDTENEIEKRYLFQKGNSGEIYTKQSGIFEKVGEGVLSKELFITKGMRDDVSLNFEEIEKMNQFYLYKWTEESDELDQEITISGKYSHKLEKILCNMDMLIWFNSASVEGVSLDCEIEEIGIIGNYKLKMLSDWFDDQNPLVMCDVKEEIDLIDIIDDKFKIIKQTEAI